MSASPQRPPHAVPDATPLCQWLVPHARLPAVPARETPRQESKAVKNELVLVRRHAWKAERHLATFRSSAQSIPAAPPSSSKPQLSETAYKVIRDSDSAQNRLATPSPHAPRAVGRVRTLVLSSQRLRSSSSASPPTAAASSSRSAPFPTAHPRCSNTAFNLNPTSATTLRSRISICSLLWLPVLVRRTPLAPLLRLQPCPPQRGQHGRWTRQQPWRATPAKCRCSNCDADDHSHGRPYSLSVSIPLRLYRSLSHGLPQLSNSPHPACLSGHSAHHSPQFAVHHAPPTTTLNALYAEYLHSREDRDTCVPETLSPPPHAVYLACSSYNRSLSRGNDGRLDGMVFAVTPTGHSDGRALYASQHLYPCPHRSSSSNHREYTVPGCARVLYNTSCSRLEPRCTVHVDPWSGL